MTTAYAYVVVSRESTKHAVRWQGELGLNLPAHCALALFPQQETRKSLDVSGFSPRGFAALSALMATWVLGRLLVY